VVARATLKSRADAPLESKSRERPGNRGRAKLSEIQNEPALVRSLGTGPSVAVVERFVDAVRGELLILSEDHGVEQTCPMVGKRKSSNGVFQNES